MMVPIFSRGPLLQSTPQDWIDPVLCVLWGGEESYGLVFGVRDELTTSEMHFICGVFRVNTGCSLGPTPAFHFCFALFSDGLLAITPPA